VTTTALRVPALDSPTVRSWREPAPIVLALEDGRDRRAIYRLRHRVYACELGQHQQNAEGVLRDRLDDVNVYLVARRRGAVVGFVAVTPPNALGYSIDKYFARDTLPFSFDDRLYEIRLLTVIPEERTSLVTPSLMYGALRYVESRGGRTIAAIGRLEVLALYTRVGLTTLGRVARSGAVRYELMVADVAAARAGLDRFEALIQRMQRTIDWQVTGVPYRAPRACYHGGAFWDAFDDEFGEPAIAEAGGTRSERDGVPAHASIINADVLDAWFDPAPEVLRRLASSLPFALRTSPPTNADGMRRVVARVRGVPADSVLPGAGSSDLIFAGLRTWVTSRSRVLILDPMYGEYAHVLEVVIGARVDRLPLSRDDGFRLRLDVLARQMERGYDWVVLVNPNSPTGRHAPRGALEAVIAAAPSRTRFWVDETYVDFVGADQSLESFAASSAKVVVCKSMSKAYALSGLRAGYLCGAAQLIAELRPLCPPWSVSLPAQIGACAALQAHDYYRARWRETQRLREGLARELATLDWDVVPGTANFLLCHLPPSGPTAAAVAARARTRGLFLRDVGNMGQALGAHALRVAVKDERTNRAMVAILRETLAMVR